MSKLSFFENRELSPPLTIESPPSLGPDRGEGGDSIVGIALMIFQNSEVRPSLTGRHQGARPGRRPRIVRRAQAGAGLGRLDNDLWSVCAAARHQIPTCYHPQGCHGPAGPARSRRAAPQSPRGRIPGGSPYVNNIGWILLLKMRTPIFSCPARGY